ncbi:hypothetical protein ACIBCH_35355 [Amycolatopsis thailandensis]|uniref:hypothetical protein n=1 Tax=Amycolatopsis thailandensis TaxID=589330 RepID=UPI0037B2A59C
MARVLLLMSAAVLLLGVAACTTPEPRALPATTTSVGPIAPGPSSTEVSTSIIAAPTTPPSKTTVPAKTKTSAKTKAEQRRTACLKDASQCYEPGTNTKCQTGGCVNAARGLTQRDVLKPRGDWLRAHPGWCPAGETGAVAPC